MGIPHPASAGYVGRPALRRPAVPRPRTNRLRVWVEGRRERREVSRLLTRAIEGKDQHDV